MIVSRTPSISQFLFCADVRASLDFLVAAFGMTQGMVNTLDDGTVRLATATLGSDTVFLSAAHPGELVPARELPAKHAIVMLYVSDVDEVFAGAVAAGAEVSYRPTDMPYGQRECGVLDLDGNLWSIATPTG